MIKLDEIIKNMATTQTNPTQIVSEIRNYLKENFLSAIQTLNLDDSMSKIVDSMADKYSERSAKFIETKISLEYMKNKLDILFEYEKHYLALIKEYKEEIKFASSLQEDLRKERANFFSATLREVYATLQATKVGPEIESMWLEKLVSSYTDSLDLSSELVKENTLSRVSELKEETIESKEEIEKQ